MIIKSIEKATWSGIFLSEQFNFYCLCFFIFISLYFITILIDIAGSMIPSILLLLYSYVETCDWFVNTANSDIIMLIWFV